MLEAFLSGLLMAVLGFALSFVPVAHQFSFQTAQSSPPDRRLRLVASSVLDPLNDFHVLSGLAEFRHPVRCFTKALEPTNDPQMARNLVRDLDVHGAAPGAAFGHIRPTTKSSQEIVTSPERSESRTVPQLVQSSVTEQHTLAHYNCPACERARIELMDSTQFAEMTFADAAPLWLATKIGRKAERTTENDAYHVRCLMKFFGAMKLKDIHAGHLFTYQQWRPSASKRKAGPSCINHEMSVLQQMLKRAGRWGTIEQWYSPMPLPKKGPGRALEPNEEAHLFKIASSDTRWKVAYCSLILTNNTTAGPGEIRKLRLKDIDTTDWVLTVREGAKNDDRVRHIPLNDEAQWAMTELLKTAKRKGAYLPEHYLLPHRGNGVGDPTRPQYTWKKAWYSLRARASEDMPSLSTLRPYDLRHHAITRLLENPDISEQTVKDIAGHVSKHILERYSHIRMDKKRKALDALCRKPVQAVQNGDSADSPKIVSS